MALGFGPSRCSNTTLPASSNTQYQLERSPRSRPIVSFCSKIFLICFAAAVLTFFIAGLLYLLCFEHVDNLGAYSIPSETGLLIPSVFDSSVVIDATQCTSSGWRPIACDHAALPTLWS